MSDSTPKVVAVAERLKALVEASMDRLNKTESSSLLTSDQHWDRLSTEQTALYNAANEAINRLTEIRNP